MRHLTRCSSTQVIRSTQTGEKQAGKSIVINPRHVASKTEPRSAHARSLDSPLSPRRPQKPMNYFHYYYKSLVFDEDVLVLKFLRLSRRARSGKAEPKFETAPGKVSLDRLGRLSVVTGRAVIISPQANIH